MELNAQHGQAVLKTANSICSFNSWSNFMTISLMISDHTWQNSKVSLDLEFTFI